MFRTTLLGVPLAVLAWLLTTNTYAQFQKGDFVAVKEKVELRVPEGKTDTLARGNSVVVEAVNGKWLWVKREKGGKAGWVDSAKVMKSDKATEYFSEQIRKNPKDAEAYYARGQQFPFIFEPKAGERTNKDALDDMNEAIRLGYKTSDAYMQRAMLIAMVNKGEDPEPILRDLNEAIRLDPNNAEAYEYRMETFKATGEYTKYLADVTTLVRLAPKEPYSHYSLAMFRAACPDARFRDGKQAIASATKACELAKWKDAAALDALGVAWAESGNYDKALEFGNKALAAIEREYQRPEFEERVALYKDKKPYRFPPPEKK